MKNQNPPIASDARIADILTERLRTAGHPEPEAWLNNLHPDTHREDLTQQAQRFHVNRRLRNYIGKFTENTLAVRTSLIDDGETEDWTRHLDKVVVPCIMKNEAPQPQTSTESCPATPD